MLFKNQIAIVTGAASGIGLAIARKLAEDGASVALLDCEERQISQLVGNWDGKHRVYSLDVTKEAAVKEAVEQITGCFGNPHILVNCAGVTGKTNLKSHETVTEDINRVFNVNFHGSYYTSKYVIPLMLEKKYGRILHVASIAGKEGNAGMLGYSASKAAVIAMAKVQGKEYAETGITVNALAPAVIRTPLVDAMPSEQVVYMTDKIPAKRCGTLEEVANLAAFIVSPMNSFTTGFTFDLSGGRATY